MRHVGIVTRDDKPEAAEAATRLERALEHRGVTVSESPELLIAVGGDGTVLSAASRALELDIPLCGINVGRVGYLAEFEVGEIDELVEAIVTGTYRMTERSVLRVDVGGSAGFAINDVVVEKVISQRIIEVAVAIDSRPLATYRTDGIIVATPLGSTAYSLSAGGPVVDPSLDAMVLTPIAPHSLLTRPVVVAPDAHVELTVDVDRPARVNVDGREFALVEPGAIVTVRKDERNVRFIDLGRHPFPEAVREQFGLDHA